MARGATMITIKADFNHMDGRGRLILSDLVIHSRTPFEALAASGKPVLFIQGEDIVFGTIEVFGGDNPRLSKHTGRPAYDMPEH